MRKVSGWRSLPGSVKAACFAIPAVLLAVIYIASPRTGKMATPPVAASASASLDYDLAAEVHGCPEGKGHQGRRRCKHDGVVRVMGSGRSGPYSAVMASVGSETHASSILALPSGDLLLAWFAGSGGQVEGGDSISITLSALRAGSEQWTAPQVVSVETGRSAQNPVMFYDGAGSVHLWHTSQEAFMGQGTSEVRHLESRDQGRTWSAPEAVFREAGAFTRNQLLLGADGKAWLMPMYFTPDGYDVFNTHYSAIKRSEDAGKTWSQFDMTAAGEFLAQPTVVRF